MGLGRLLLLLGCIVVTALGLALVPYAPSGEIVWGIPVLNFDGNQFAWLSVPGGTGVLVVGLGGAGVVTLALYGVGLLMATGQLAAGMLAIGQLGVGLVAFLGQLGGGLMAIGQLIFGVYGVGQVPIAWDGEAFFDDLDRRLSELLPGVKRRTDA